MIKRILRLILERYLIQLLIEKITESISSWAVIVCVLIELFIQHQLQPAIARIDFTNFPKYATKPMFGFLVPVFLGGSLFLLFLPIYMIFLTAFYAGWDTAFVSSQFRNMLPMIDKIAFVVIFAIFARLRMPQLEQWADSIWGASCQKDIDFCNRQLFTLKVGVVFSFAFSAFPLIIFLV